MAIPLPTVVSDVGPGGGVTTAARGANALTRENLENTIKGAEAQYAPYTSYANAASKIAYSNLLPWQIQSSVLANPYMWAALKDHPDQANALLKNFAQGMPNMGNVMGNINMPAPTQNSNGQSLLMTLLGKLQRDHDQDQKSSNNPMEAGSHGAQNGLMQSPNASGPGSALVPASQGAASGIGGQATAKFTESPYKGGALIPDPNNPGQLINVPTEQSKQAFQTAAAAAARVTPMIEKVSEEIGDFLDVKGQAKLIGSRIGNLFGLDEETLKKMGLSGNLPSKYAAAQAHLKTIPADLLKSYGLVDTVDAMQRLGTAVEPIIGEGRKGYQARVLNTLNEIKQEQIGNTASLIGNGFQVPGSPQSSSQSPVSGNFSPESLSQQPPGESGMPEVTNPQAGNYLPPTPQAIKETAEKYHMTEAQVKQYLGIG